MFKFRGFRASFDFITGKQRGFDCDLTPVSINGSYRTCRDENNVFEDTFKPHRTIVPSMVQLPPSQSTTPMKQSKSSEDLLTLEPAQNVRKSAPDLSFPEQTNNTSIKEQKRLDKQRMIEQKNQEKLAAKEKQKQEKLAKEKLKQEKISRSKKKNAPTPPQPPNQNVPPSQLSPINQQTLQNQNYSKTQQETPKQNAPPVPNTNIRPLAEDTSLSQPPPPPYGEFPEIKVDDARSNITFGKPVNDSSWELISEHREQMSKPTSSAPIAPKRRKDMEYNVGSLRLGGNSEAR
ncbi:unnamed protein product [Leptosia nina]|uniref:Uncharacterized protein n=1 Tax=Leptosia nina TaxID=320188 RepID=A0AAV1JTB9_9NEOP